MYWKHIAGKYTWKGLFKWKNCILNIGWIPPFPYVHIYLLSLMIDVGQPMWTTYYITQKVLKTSIMCIYIMYRYICTPFCTSNTNANLLNKWGTHHDNIIRYIYRRAWCDSNLNAQNRHWSLYNTVSIFETYYPL